MKPLQKHITINKLIYIWGREAHYNRDSAKPKNLSPFPNIITIRGIDNSSDQSNNDQAVSIDHRVNVSRTSPIIINLRRETMLDSHFEVRPLRIRANMKDNRFNGGNIPANTAVKVEISKKQTTGTGGNWIGLERSYGTGSVSDAGTTYCTGSGDYGTSSAGKRKYFTTNLTTATLAGANGQTVIVPVTQAGECVWIYVDECDEEAEASTDLQAIRSAEITVTYGTLNGSEFTPDDSVQPVKYVINQHLLYKIQSSNDLNGDGSTANDYYYIEHEEEYLYNFDAEDNYEKNQTQFEGMMWGLNDVQLSKTHDAMHVEDIPAGGLATIINIIEQFLGGESIDTKTKAEIKKKYDPKYDFYIFRDLQNNDLPTDGEKIKYRNYAGYTFNTEIASYILNTYSTHQGENSSADTKINGIKLDEQPKSAFAYCYNRNKRNADGEVVSQDWYMPSIDELEEIMELAHIQFEDFQGQLYWSCQPAYDKIYILFEVWQNHWAPIVGSWDTHEGNFGAIMFIDDKDRARATRVKRENGEFKDVLSSDADTLGTRAGNITLPVSGYPTFTISDNLTPNPNFDSNFTNYPGNLPRTGKKCRVRAVRKMTTTTTN